MAFDDYLSGLTTTQQPAAQEAPSAFERGAAYVFEKAPILRDVLMHFAKLGSTVANVTEAGILGLQGHGGQAWDRLGAAGRQFTDFITSTIGAPAEAVGRLFGASDVVPNLSKPTDFQSMADVLRTAGVGELGSVNLPLFGRVTGRGALGLGLDIVTDPLTYTGIGEATKNFVGPELARNLLKPGETLLGAQAHAGERSLISFAGRPIVRGAPVLDTFEKVVDTLKNSPASPFRFLTLYSKPETRLATVAGHIGEGMAKRQFLEGGQQIATRIEGKVPVYERASLQGIKDSIDAVAAQRGVDPAAVAFEVTSAKQAMPVPRYAKEARQQQFLSKAAGLEEKAAIKEAYVGRTRSAVEKSMDRDVNALMGEAGKVTIDAFKTAGRLGDLENAARKAGNTILADAYNAASARVVQAATRREAAMLASAIRAEKAALGTSEAASKQVGLAGARINALAAKMEARFKTAKLVPEVDKIMSEVASMAHTGTPDISSLVGDIAKGAETDLADAQKIIADATRPGQTAIKSSADRASSIASSLIEREQRRTTRLVKLASRMEETRAAVREGRLAEAARLRSKAGALVDKASAPDLQVERVRNAYQMGRLGMLMNRYVAEGYTKSEAYRAATTSILKGIDPDVAPIAAEADRVLRGMLQDQNVRGVAVEALSDPYKSYVTNAFSDEFRQWLKDNKKDPSVGEPAFRRWTAKTPSAKKRQAIYEGKPIAEMEQELKKKFPGYDGPIFHQDIRDIIQKVSAQRLGRAVSGADYMDVVGRYLSRPASQELLDAGWVRLGDVAQKSGKVLPGDQGLLTRTGLRASREAFRGGEQIPTRFAMFADRVIPPEVAAEMLKTYRITTAPPNVLLRALDWFNRGFKTFVTVPFPSFHARNAIGNFWNNFIGGVWNPRSYADAFSLWKDFEFGPKNRVWDMGGGRSMTTKQVIDNLDAGGALGYSGQFSEEELAKGFAAAPGLKQMRNAGQQIESHAKIAHFIDKMRAGYSPEEAILSIKKYLFDYSELSPIEKGYFRPVVPFYTWQRKNWPLILETLFAKPSKAAGLAHFDAAMRARSEGGGPIETTVLPGYISRRLLKIDQDKEGILNVVAGFGLPFEDLALMDRPFNEFAAMLSPPIKGIFQQVTNTDYFRDIPLDRSEYAPSFLKVAKYIPGVGQPFLDWMGFREVKPDVYRANPRILNWMWSLGAAAQRGAGILDTAGREGGVGALQKWVSPVYDRQFTPQEQIRQNYRHMVELYVDHLEELQRAGVTGRAEDFYIRRDMLPTDPKVAEARQLNHDLAAAKKMLGRMSVTERAMQQREGLRSGGLQ